VPVIVALSKEEKPKSSYSIFPEDEYRVRIDGYNPVNRVSKFNPKGLETIDFYLTPVSIAEDDQLDLVDTDGKEPVEGSRLVFFFDPNKMGQIPVMSKNRKFLAAALGVAPEGHLELDNYDDLIGVEMYAAVIIKDGRNNVTDVRPIRRRTRTRVETKPEEAPEPAKSVAKSPAVKAAEDVFGEDLRPSVDDF